MNAIRRTFVGGLLIASVICLTALWGAWSLVKEPWKDLRPRLERHANSPLPEPIRSAIIAAEVPEKFMDGASPTHQLAKMSVLHTTKQPRPVRRNIAEYFTSMLANVHYSGDEILRAYAREVWLGGEVTGVDQAADLYLGKSTEDLTIGEAALLVGLIKRPGYYLENSEKLLERRDEVLRKMLDRDLIDDDQFETANNSFVERDLP